MTVRDGRVCMTIEQTRADAFSCVVVAPTYQNARTLPAVLEGLGPAGLPVIAVNDGSTDDTAAYLETWSAADPQVRHVVTHPANRGKAWALASGFAKARELGHSHALTIDTDGQLDPAQVPMMMAAARAAPRRLVLGQRDDRAADYPGRSRLGRRLSNLAVFLETGRRVADSQCGFRVYPLGLVACLRCRAGRYAWETEVVTRALWAGAAVEQRPVRCRYDVVGGRVTHFRLVRDTLSGLVLHARLLGRALVPLGHRRCWEDDPAALRGSGDDRPRWRRALQWLNPLTSWRALRQGRYGRGELAIGLSVGVFIANLPIYGLHTASCLYLAARLHLNPHLVVVGSTIATPPVGPVLIALAVVTGHLMLNGRLDGLGIESWAELGEASLYGRLLLEWTLGSLVVGGVLALLTLTGSYTAFGWLSRRR